MMNRISNRITQYLISNNVISDSSDSIKYYKYSIEITLSSFFNIIEIVFIGFMFHQIFESLIFLIVFIPLRMFTGGYHASTYFRCHLYFCILFSLLLIVYSVTSNTITDNECLIIVLINEVILITECPVVNQNNPVSEFELRRNRVIAIVLGTFINTTGIILTYLSYKIGVLVLYTHLLVSILVIVAMIMNERMKMSYEE